MRIGDLPYPSTLVTDPVVAARQNAQVAAGLHSSTRSVPVTPAAEFNIQTPTAVSIDKAPGSPIDSYDRNGQPRRRGDSLEQTPFLPAANPTVPVAHPSDAEGIPSVGISPEPEDRPFRQLYSLVRRPSSPADGPAENGALSVDTTEALRIRQELDKTIQESRRNFSFLPGGTFRTNQFPSTMIDMYI